MLSQALISKSLETLRFVDAVVVAPEDATARAALLEHLSGLRWAVEQLGFAHLGRALADTAAGLERESFSLESLRGARELAGRYASLAAMPAGSDAHPALADPGAAPLDDDAQLHGRRVLVASGEAPMRWSCVGVLRDAGARVFEARDGLEALELARADAPDLVVADAALPGLDGLALCAAIRRDRSLDHVGVILLSRRGSEATRALVEAGGASGSQVEASLEVLRGAGIVEQDGACAAAAVGDDDSQDASIQDGRRGPRAGRPSGRSTVRGETPWLTDPLERENIRAQAAVAMHREPANRAARSDYPIWRVSIGPDPGGAAALSPGFDAQIDVIARVLGLGFIALLAGTLVVLARSQWAGERGAAATTAPAPTALVEDTVRERLVIELPPPAPAPAPGDGGLTAFSGELRPGVDSALELDDGQGVLELDGPAEVTVEIDGVEHGSLPVTAVLEEGRHQVRYRLGSRTTVRFYTVRAGATRALRAFALPGGFIDAR